MRGAVAAVVLLASCAADDGTRPLVQLAPRVEAPRALAPDTLVGSPGTELEFAL